jgi:hypothetical protein
MKDNIDSNHGLLSLIIVFVFNNELMSKVLWFTILCVFVSIYVNTYLYTHNTHMYICNP